VGLGNVTDFLVVFVLALSVAAFHRGAFGATFLSFPPLLLVDGDVGGLVAPDVPAVAEPLPLAGAVLVVFW
jgi:hypothetical protein